MAKSARLVGHPLLRSDLTTVSSYLCSSHAHIAYFPGRYAFINKDRDLQEGIIYVVHVNTTLDY